MSDSNVASRNYRDVFSFKEFALEKAKVYFPDQDISTLNIGMIGYTTELIGTTTEDAFNTISTLIKEMFPNKAQLPDSIYSHAAVFQLGNIFAGAASCRFLLIFEEDVINSIIESINATGTNVDTMYIDKDTQIVVQDIVFTLDYDIAITRKIINDERVYSARYVTLPFSNSISEITNPYIKVRKSKENFLALEIVAHQCIRTVETYPIINNTKINYPTIDIEFEGILAGFDVLYKTPTEDDYNTQMKTLVVESQAIEEPFCYYRMKDTNILQLSFSNIDTYFQPVFNSEIQVTLYTTDGKNGNFEVYQGTNVDVICTSERYWYNNNMVLGAKPTSESVGGTDAMTLDELQQLTVEQYATATALTTDNDLELFFRNYQYRYDNNIKFIKRRDDVSERLFAGYLIMNDDGYIYPTATLDLSINYLDMYNPTDGYLYTMDPGIVFTYEDGRTDRLVPVFTKDHDHRLDLYYHWCQIEHPDWEYGVADKDTPFADWNMRYQFCIAFYDDETSGIDKETYPTAEEYAWAVMCGDLDFPYVQFQNWDEPDGEDLLTVFDDEFFDLLEENPNGFYFSNPFLVSLTTKPNIFGYYLTIVDKYSLLDFTNYNDDSFMQFIMTELHVSRGLTKDKRYDYSLNVLPSIASEPEDICPSLFPVYEYDDAGEIISETYPSYKENPLRVIMTFLNGDEELSYLELVPTKVNEEDQIQFNGHFLTDDHITTSGNFRILSDDSEPGGTIVYMQNKESQMIPMEDVTIKIYTLYREPVTEYGRKTVNKFYTFDDTLVEYVWTNEFSTYSDTITFIRPLNMIRSNIYFRDDRAVKINTGDVYIYSMPFIKYELMLHYKSTGEENTVMKDRFTELIRQYTLQYENLETVLNTTLRNTSHLDIKFYTTYGKSKNYLIGDNDEVIDRVNITIKFDIYVSTGTDLVAARRELQQFIKEQVETVNDLGSNDLYISNLIRQIENNFAYVDHLKFCGINEYSTDYQTIKNITKDLNDLDKNERYKYVPELLVCNTEDVLLNMFEVE